MAIMAVTDVCVVNNSYSKKQLICKGWKFKLVYLQRVYYKYKPAAIFFIVDTILILQ